MDMTVGEFIESLGIFFEGLSLGGWFLTYCVTLYFCGIFIMRGYVQKRLSKPANTGDVVLESLLFYTLAPISVPYMILWNYWSKK